MSVAHEKPDWMDIIKWDPPHRLRELVVNRQRVPEFNGLYAFNLDQSELKKGRVLYVGECDRIGGFRARFHDYLAPAPTKAKTRHKGALFLQDYRLKNPDDFIWVRWAPFDTDKRFRRDLEAAIMQYYGAWFNSRDMNADTPFDTI